VIGRFWLPVLLVGLAIFVLGGIAAPVLAFFGAQAAADALYSAYALTCHQWAFRSFFLFGQQVVFGRADLEALGVDPYGFDGHPELGWKMAFCERDLAIYLGLLLAGAFFYFARRRDLSALGLGVYALLILPMAVDGGTQYLGWRESTWELRVITGLVFGVASAWLLFPRLDAFFGVQPLAGRYAADIACAPQPPRG
jgi:uncharacterized membrane protein